MCRLFSDSNPSITEMRWGFAGTVFKSAGEIRGRLESERFCDVLHRCPGFAQHQTGFKMDAFIEQFERRSVTSLLAATG